MKKNGMIYKRNTILKVILKMLTGIKQQKYPNITKNHQTLYFYLNYKFSLVQRSSQYKKKKKKLRRKYKKKKKKFINKKKLIKKLKIYNFNYFF